MRHGIEGVLDVGHVVTEAWKLDREGRPQWLVVVDVLSATSHLVQYPDGKTNCNSYREETDPVRKLISFIGISLDGYYQGPNGEFDFANVDQEFYDFSNRQDAYIDTLMFGRATYELMAAYWPTATEDDPEVIAFMNDVPKVAVSTTLERADWNNTTLIGDNLAESVKELKGRPGKEIAMFGSVRLTASLLELGLVDELRVMVFPILLGDGASMFSTLNGRVPLELWRTQTFRSGNVLLVYCPA